MENEKKKNKFLKFMKMVLKNKIGRIITIAVIVLILFLGYILLFSNRNAKVDTTYMIAKLEKASELTTAKLTYTGFTEFTDKGALFLNRADFKMIYKATARAGIDVKDIIIKEPNKVNKTITIEIPKARILDIKVESSNIKYFDEKFSLFNVDEKEDANEAVTKAEKKAKEELSNMGILEMADTQAEALIKGLLQESIPDGYKLIFKVKE